MALSVKRNLTADPLRFTQKEILLRISPQRRKERRELNFCLSGDDDKQKHSSSEDWAFLPNRRLPIGQNFFPQRTLRLCGEMSESLSARIGVNLRLSS
jgi:hypothetical protein